MPDPVPTDSVEDLASFRHRLRTWLKENMEPARPATKTSLISDEVELEEVVHCRVLQRRLYDGGFAGIIFPREFGGLGLTPDHQEVFNEEIVGYEYPRRIQVPTFTPCAALINDFGTDEQKRTHLPPIFKGDALWMQMLSEPGGGSDVAGAQTTAKRDGDDWLLNGSKIWTSGAWWADWALCLARTDWDVPKHNGLSVFMLRLDDPGVEIQRIEMLGGSRDFCQEFLTNVRIPDRNRLGEVDDGWTVGTRWMFHEKSLAISPYITRPRGTMRGLNPWVPPVLEVARQAGRLNDPVGRQLVGEGHALKVVAQEAAARIARSIKTGRANGNKASLSRIVTGIPSARMTSINFELAGPAAVAWSAEEATLGELGVEYLLRQMWQITGGTLEMSRNTVSERFLGMPREARNDRNIPFRDVPRGTK